MGLYLKVLGLTAMAAVAGAIAGSAAAAQSSGKFTSDGPVTLVGTQTGINALTAFFYEVECPGSTYAGHKVLTPNDTTFEPPKKHELLASGSTEITFTAQHTNCTTFSASGAFPVTMDMNGCDYVLRIGATTSELHTYAASLDVVCPVGKHVQITAFTGSSHSIRVCTITLKPQTNLVGAHLTTTTSPWNDVDLGGTFKNVHVEQSGICGTQTTGVAEFHTEMTLRGRNAAGETTTLSISD